MPGSCYWDKPSGHWRNLSLLCAEQIKTINVFLLFLNLLILCEFIKVSGKKYIIRKVWLYTIYTIYQLCNGWVEFFSYFSVYIQTHNGTLTRCALNFCVLQEALDNFQLQRFNILHKFGGNSQVPFLHEHLEFETRGRDKGNWYYRPFLDRFL